MKKAWYLLVMLVFWGCSSIAFNKSPQLKEQEVADMTFQYPKQDVFNACISSLESSGWTVTSSNYEAGTISGIRPPDPALPAGAENMQRLATVSIVEKGARKTDVEITAGISDPNPAAETAGASTAPKARPNVCAPLLLSVQETLLKGTPAPPK